MIAGSALAVMAATAMPAAAVIPTSTSCATAGTTPIFNSTVLGEESSRTFLYVTQVATREFWICFRLPSTLATRDLARHIIDPVPVLDDIDIPEALVSGVLIVRGEASVQPPDHAEGLAASCEQTVIDNPGVIPLKVMATTHLNAVCVSLNGVGFAASYTLHSPTPSPVLELWIDGKPPIKIPPL